MIYFNETTHYSCISVRTMYCIDQISARAARLHACLRPANSMKAMTAN